MGVSHEQLVDKVLPLNPRRRLAAAAAALGLIVRHRLGLGVATPGQRDHQIFFRDEVLDREVTVILYDLGAACVGKIFPDLLQFRSDHRLKPVRVG